jgi:hypothetical protein
MAKCLAEASILERMTDQFRNMQRQKREEVEAAVKARQTKSGCLVFVVALLSSVAAAALTIR